MHVDNQYLTRHSHVARHLNHDECTLHSRVNLGTHSICKRQVVVRHLLTAGTSDPSVFVDVVPEDMLSRRTYETTYEGVCHLVGPSLENV